MGVGTHDYHLHYSIEFDYWSANMLFLGPGSDSNTDLRATHVVEYLSLSMISSFQFGLILGSFMTFWGPTGLFLGLG